MKRKLKLKPFVIPMIYVLFVIALLITIFTTEKNYVKPKNENLTYVSSTVIEEDKPVINLEVQIMRPYSNSNTSIGIDYYNQNDNEENKKKSIIYYADTYMPNSGIDYINNEKFDILSILDGEVIEIKEEELLGKTITIRHNNDLISVYQGLGEILVDKDEKIAIGQIIGKSGTNELNKNVGNHLHFELIYKGQTVDPEDYFDKKISELN